MIKKYQVILITPDNPSLIGRYMLVFTRRRIHVSDFAYSQTGEGQGEMTIDFEADEWTAENVRKQLAKQIDILQASLQILA
jgi:acetolactate synthase regulatory subunit